jgi:chromosome segregation ATPase
MKRIAIALAAIAATFIAMPTAHADKPQECVTVAALPGSCLDQATADYIAAQDAENRELREQFGTVSNENADLRVELWQAVAERNDARLWQHIAEDNLTDAYTRIDLLRQRVKALRAKVRTLEARV